MTRAERLRAIADVHDSWVWDHLDDAAFDPHGRAPESDYNQHYADVDATGAAEDDFAMAVASAETVQTADGQGIEAKYDPNQPRRGDGTWGDGPRPPDLPDGGDTTGPSPDDDKLGLTTRINLAPGERLLGSREGAVTSQSESVPVMAAIKTDTGVELRLGIVNADDSEKWSAANKGGTAVLGESAIANMNTALDAEMVNARRWQKQLNEQWDELEAADADLADLRAHDDASQADIDAAAGRLEELQAAWDTVQTDPKLAEGVIPGSNWGDIAYQVWGSGDDNFGWHVELVVKPHDAGTDWNWDDATFGGEQARLDLADWRRMQRQVKALMALGDAPSTTNTAGPLPIRAITEGDHRMGGRTAARAERTRMRVDSKRKWFRIQNTSAGTDIYLYGEIGCYGVTAADFTEELRQITSPVITVHINSPGGDVFDGVAIFEALKNHPATVNVTVDGVAASAASFIACAGDKITIARYAQMMIHEASMGVFANAKRLRKQADTLEKTDEIISNIYADRAGGEASVWRGLMDAETWFNAEEAVQFGLADGISGDPAGELVKAAPAKAVWDLSVFAYAGRDKAPAPALVMALAAEPETPDAEPAAVEADPVEDAPTAVEAEPVEQPADEPGDSEPAADPAPSVPEVPIVPEVPAIPDPITAQPLAWAPPAWATTPADAWRSLVAGLTNPEPSTPGDQLASAQEANQ